jgi:hypothetical protein
MKNGRGMNLKNHLIYRLAIAKYEIYSTFNVAFVEVMATLIVPQGILDPHEGALGKDGFVPKYSRCHGLCKIVQAYIHWMVIGVLLKG